MKTLLLARVAALLMATSASVQPAQAVKLTRHGEYYRWNREPMVPMHVVYGCIAKNFEDDCIKRPGKKEPSEDADPVKITRWGRYYRWDREPMIPMHVITGCLKESEEGNDIEDCIKRPWAYLMESGFCKVRAYACTSEQNKKTLKDWAREKIRGNRK